MTKRRRSLKDKKDNEVENSTESGSEYENSNEDDDKQQEDDLIEFLKLFQPKKVEVIYPAPKKHKTDVCNNPLCDHKPAKKKNKNKIPNITIPSITRIETLQDLIDLGKSYHCKRHTHYHKLNLRILCNLVPVLTKLQSMIGLEDVKVRIVEQILYFLRGYHLKEKCGKCSNCAFGLQCSENKHDMLHTVITGVPGIGKTEFGRILGEIYNKMEILSNNSFHIFKRSDLIAEYLGQTAIKTQEAINKCTGGVMFIDEAYALGEPDNRDSFSKECLDTLNQNLSEKRDFLCIIAGYKDSLDRNFFAANEGLRRRFTFRYDLQPYTAQELFKIFEKKVSDAEWSIDYSCGRDNIEKLFVENYKNFNNYAGDMETLLLNSRICNSKRCNLEDVDKCLSYEDIKKGIEITVKNRGIHKQELPNHSLWGMYI